VMASRIHLLPVASAILGMVISVFPMPSPMCDRSQMATRECDSPSSPLPDDAEGADSADVEANGLTSTISSAYARFTDRPAYPALPVPSGRTWDRSRIGVLSLPANLPIILCRLTC
jgi:hypothetical protein